MIEQGPTEPWVTINATSDHANSTIQILDVSMLC